MSPWVRIYEKEKYRSPPVSSVHRSVASNSRPVSRPLDESTSAAPSSPVTRSDDRATLRTVLPIVHAQEERRAKLSVELDVPHPVRRLLQTFRIHPILKDDGGASRSAREPVIVLFDTLLKSFEGVDLEEHLVEEQAPPTLDQRPPARVEREGKRRPW